MPVPHTGGMSSEREGDHGDLSCQRGGQTDALGEPEGVRSV